MAGNLIAIITAAVLIFVSGCETDAQNDALIGSAAGAGIGAIVGHQSGHAAGGALIGGAVGGGAGYIIGNESDKKKERESSQYQSAPQYQSQPSYQPAPEQNTVTVWLTNSNGSKTPVRLTRSGSNYIGPRGEIYNTLPTEEQLRPIYGM